MRIRKRPSGTGDGLTRQLTRHQPSILVQLVDLFLIEFTNWRWSWRGMVILGMIAPLTSILALGIFARDSGQEALAYVLSGNVVLALMFENQNKVQSHFTFMRFQGTLDYYATLPIRKHAVILAVVCSFLLLSVPSLTVTVFLGSLVLDVPLKLSPLILIVVPACVIPMAGIGALIGTSARTPQEAGSLSLLVMTVMLGLGPVVIPPERLPDVVLALGRFSPATYAASALRQALLGPVTGQIVRDLAALAGFGVVVFVLVGRKMDWRHR
jgi:ABC-2 type transport system permease protein